MRRTVYVVVLFSLALVWLAHRMRLSVAKLATGEKTDKALDFHVFGYDADLVRGYFSRLGEAGRRHYLKKYLRLDAIFALCYGIAGAAIGFWIASLIHQAGYRWLAWLPGLGGFAIAAAALFDIDEGQAVGTLLRAWPTLDPAVVARASRATRFKWIAVIGGLALVTLGLGIAGVALLKGG
jgi:hypothetical protein